MNKCTIVGLTGGIASGKSTISRYIEAHGFPVFDADACGHMLMQKSHVAWQDIVESFGQDILLPDGQIDRKKLGAIVFANQERLRVLESIMHKRILEKSREFIAEHQDNCKLLILDVPLLIEAGWCNQVDEVWLVYLTQEEQIRRAALRDLTDTETIKQRINQQLSFEQKKKFATRTIDNSGNLQNTLQQVDKLLALYKN